MIKCFKGAACALAFIPGLALAAAAPGSATPRYSYVEGGYVNYDFDNFDEDGDGFQVGGSLAIHRNFHLVADYADIDLSGSADATLFDIGIGGNAPLRPGLDVIGRVLWLHEEVDVGPQNRDDDGYGLEAGLRMMINPQLELDGSVKYVDIFDDDNTSLKIGGLYDIVNNFALGADIEFSDDVTVFFLKGRFYFGGAVASR